MIRFTWLRFRAQAAVAFGALVVVAIILALTGFHMAAVYNAAVVSCQSRGDCAAVLHAFPPAPDRTVWGLTDDLVTLVPGLIGIFWGAPLVAREFETGTFRLAWTQGISRTRWLAVKLGVVGALSMIVAGLLSALATWWSRPLEQASLLHRIELASFHAGGIVPVGYTAFAFALGVTAGLLIRRTLPAMAVTLVIFAAVQFAVPVYLRPHLIPPVTTTAPLNVASVVEWGVTEAGQPGGGNLFVATAPSVPGAWMVSSEIVTPAGRPAATEPATSACGDNATMQSCQTYVAGLRLRQVETYQPASRYWPLQWYETGIYLAAALLLSGLCFLRIRRGRPAGGDGWREPGQVASLQNWRRPASSHQSA
jgi:ABC-2 family transporter protein